ncbi:CAP domain-containing protein, partial [Albidovulum sp.]|uniref:CAP domain-containing protein n=1 Tax=Albidovulum sp. TaxID=1872424 RepID=UPI0039B95964
MAWTAEEQFMLELVNRARLDPAAEALRYGISLNQGLASGTITASAREVLAPDGQLQDAASDHSLWMLGTDTFSHTGAGGSDPGSRMSGAGYIFANGWSWGENIAWRGSTGALQTGSAIAAQHGDLFLSPGHRTNILGTGFRELGIAQETGGFTTGGVTYNASMVTQDYAKSGPDVFLTGVAYSDGDHDGFYSIGEGTSGVGFAIGGNATATAAAGGYALKLAPAAGVGVTVTASGGAVSQVLVDLSGGNVKLDLVDGTLLRSSGNLTLVSGVAAAELLGITDLTLTGNALANRLTGNRGHNVLTGADGSDSLSGGIGNDTLYGGNNYDTIRGGDGNDQAWGGNGRDLIFLGNGDDVFWDNGQADANGHDTVWGGAGNDTVNGGGGNELIYGEAGIDSLLGGIGDDTIYAGDNYDTVRGGDGNDQVW